MSTEKAPELCKGHKIKIKAKKTGHVYWLHKALFYLLYFILHTPCALLEEIAEQTYSQFSQNHLIFEGLTFKHLNQAIKQWPVVLSSLANILLQQHGVFFVPRPNDARQRP